LEKNILDIVIIGGGASSFFLASNLDGDVKECKKLLIEQSKQFLSKVRISGGGRCNVTNEVGEPKELKKFYPRGNKELLGPFHHFNCIHTFDWFEERGLALKIEEDGRVFPVSDNSEDVISILVNSTKGNNVKLLQETKVLDFNPIDKLWHITTSKGNFITKVLVLGTGSSKFIWEKLGKLGIEIVESVPSLFTFKLNNRPLKGLEGISVNNVGLRVKETSIQQSGPMLITHEGLSGPAVLKSSAFGARILSEKEYQFDIEVNWLPMYDEKLIYDLIKENGKKILLNGFTFLPNRLWERLLVQANVSVSKKWAELRKEEISRINLQIFHSVYEVNGKSTFKDEFVTAGGIALHEVNFKNFTLKKYPNVYCIGEMLDIDAVTGGFNFQACWTGAYLASLDIKEKFLSI
jgi:predicted Rossmann fold flavoprotein